MIYEIVIGMVAFCVGVLVQRIYIARVRGLFKQGHSWDLSGNKLYRMFHRFYCETCPRRLYCGRYKKEKERKK